MAVLDSLAKAFRRTPIGNLAMLSAGLDTAFGTAYGCSLTKSADQTIGASATVAVTWDEEFWDSGGFHDNVTNNTRITIPSGLGGKFFFGAVVQWQNQPTGYQSYLRVDGTTNYPGLRTNIDAIDMASPFPPIALSAGQYVELMILNAEAAGRDIRGGLNNQTDCALWCVRIGA